MGKYDQYQRDAATAGGITQALRALAHLLLAQPESVVAQHRERVANALGRNLCILTGAVPQWALLLGEQEATAAIDPAEAQQRLAQTLVGVVGAIASPKGRWCLCLTTCTGQAACRCGNLTALRGSHRCAACFWWALTEARSCSNPGPSRPCSRDGRTSGSRIPGSSWTTSPGPGSRNSWRGCCGLLPRAPRSWPRPCGRTPRATPSTPLRPSTPCVTKACCAWARTDGPGRPPPSGISSGKVTCCTFSPPGSRGCRPHRACCSMHSAASAAASSRTSSRLPPHFHRKRCKERLRLRLRMASWLSKRRGRTRSVFATIACSRRCSQP